MDDVSLGELARRMDMLHTDVRELRGVIVERDDLSAMGNAWNAALTAHESKADLRHQSVDARITALEAWQTWVIRIILGIVVTAVIGVVIANPNLLGGR